MVSHSVIITLISKSAIITFSYHHSDIKLSIHHKNITIISHLPAVVQQSFRTNVLEANVLRGNSALFKCEIPSFVADFVQVTAWQEDISMQHYYHSMDIGTLDGIHAVLYWYDGYWYA
jgi:hypothetical protein